VITGFLLKRAMSGHLPLMPAIKKLLNEVLAGVRDDNSEGDFLEERRIVSTAKKIALFAAGVASQKYMQAIQNEQEVMAAIANMTIETYAMESALLRARKMSVHDDEASNAVPLAATRVYLMDAMERIESSAKTLLTAASEGDDLRHQMAVLRRLCKYEMFNRIALRQMLAQRVIESGKFVSA
jgi:hypothetical protein